MEIVTIIWSLGAGVALTLAGVCGLMWLLERRLATLMLCLLGVATAASAYVELGMMNAATPEDYGAWLQWYHLPVFLALVAQVLFVHFYLGMGRAWLMWTIIFARAVVLVANFAVEPNFHFSDIASLRQVSLFGEQVSAIGVAATRAWQWFALASLILLMAYLIDAAVQGWLKGEAGTRRKATAVALGIAIPLLATITYTQLLVFGVIHGPVSNVPWFLGALVMMAYELGRDFILSARARLELAELRSKLAQVERVNVLGQFASALAHELAQPLHGITLNVAAARAKSEEPDLEELRATLDDIDDDGRRASEIVHRMRQLFQRRKVVTQPVNVEDVMEDVYALVRAEAKAKNVSVYFLVQPKLPRVFGDRLHLSQVMLNLVTNSLHAVQSRPAEARRIAVEARADQANGQVEIVVRDSGPGIPTAMAEKIFTPFFSTRPDGMGIGLALSRTIIEAQGGRLWADDQTAQEGAVFRLTLRRA